MHFFPPHPECCLVKGQSFYPPLPPPPLPIEILGENGASMVDAFLPRSTYPLPCLCSVCSFYKRGSIHKWMRVYFIGWFSSKEVGRRSQNWVSRVHEIMIHASSCSNPLKVRGQNKGWWGGGGSDVSTQPLVNSPRFIMANFYTVACTVCLSNLARHVAAAFRLYFIVSDKLVRSCTPLNHEFPTYSSSKVSRRRLVA